MNTISGSNSRRKRRKSKGGGFNPYGSEGPPYTDKEIKRLRKLREAAAKNKKMMTRNLRNRERQKGRLTKKAAVFSDEDLLQVLSDRALRTIKRQVESHKSSERRRAERLLSHASDASS